jgi:hypothetical protein
MLRTWLIARRLWLVTFATLRIAFQTSLPAVRTELTTPRPWPIVFGTSPIALRT